MVILRRRLQDFYEYEEDDLREIVSAIVVSLKIRYGVDRSGLGTAT